MTIDAGSAGPHPNEDSSLPRLPRTPVRLGEVDTPISGVSFGVSWFVYSRQNSAAFDRRGEPNHREVPRKLQLVTFSVVSGQWQRTHYESAALTD